MNLRRLGRSAEALSAYDEASRLVPDDPVILANRGMVLCDVGRLEEGAAAYRRSIRLRPDYAPTHQLLAAARRHERYDGDVPVNLGAGFEISIRDLAGLLAELTGYRGRLVFDASKPSGQRRRCADVSRARELFGFQAEVGFREGLGRTIEWYRTHAAVAR